MIPTVILSLIKDILIIGAIGFLIWLLVNYGKDIVKVSDLKALESQITQNAKSETQWRKEQDDANTQRDLDVSSIVATINAQHSPVYVLRNGSASSCPVPGHTSQADDSIASTGSTHQGSGIDLRPAINAFELKYETALADCRRLDSSWPH